MSTSSINPDQTPSVDDTSSSDSTPPSDTSSSDTAHPSDTASTTALDPVALDHSEEGAPEVEAEELHAGHEVTEEYPTFAEMGVRQETVDALAKAGIVRTFAIQQMTLQIAMGGHDLIGQARTGTGKTLGFGVPLLERILGPDEGADGTPQALVVVPTRELCVQVARDIKDAGALRRVRVESIYGGRAYEPQIEALQRGVDVVVGTPGRLIDLAEQAKLVLGKVKILVLDEADEMLDLGFLPDIEKILRLVPEQRQTMLFSATMPGPIVTMARQFMNRPTHIRAEAHDDQATVPAIRQIVYRAHAMDKAELLARVLQTPGRELTLIFTRTKRTAQNVADEMADRGFAAAAVHGDLGQGAREQAMRAFRSGKVDVLVATDVAARGLDISGVSHVINYQIPEDEKTYVHRIGRTGRAGKDGIAITFVDWDDLPRWSIIDKLLDLGIPEPEETYSTSPHVYTDLDIPETATGRLPRAQRTREGLDAERIEDLGGRDRAPRGGGRGRGRDGGRAGGRDGGRRDGGRSGGSDGDGDAPARRPRSGKPRKRTRGSGAARAAAEGSATGTTAGASGEAAAGSASEGQGNGTSTGAPRRRRRRGGRGRGRAAGESGSAGATPSQES